MDSAKDKPSQCGFRFNSVRSRTRNRSANFSDSEIRVMLNLVEQHKGILCEKKYGCDTSTPRMRNVAWQMVTAAVNAVESNPSRTLMQIKKKWCDLKMAALRYRRAKDKVARTKLGGKPAYFAHIMKIVKDDLTLFYDNEAEAAEKKDVSLKEILHEYATEVEEAETSEGKTYTLTVPPTCDEQDLDVPDVYLSPAPSDHDLNLYHNHNDIPCGVSHIKPDLNGISDEHPSSVKSVGLTASSRPSNIHFDASSTTTTPTATTTAATTHSEVRCSDTPVLLQTSFTKTPASTSVRQKNNLGAFCFPNGQSGSCECEPLQAELAVRSRWRSVLWEEHLREKIKTSQMQQKLLERDLTMQGLLRQQIQVDIDLKRSKMEYYLAKTRGLLASPNVTQGSSGIDSDTTESVQSHHSSLSSVDDK